MSFLSGRIEKWASVEDEELWNLYSDLYGPLYWMSTLFPSWLPHRRFRTVAIFVLYIVILTVHLSVLSVSVVLLSDDIEMASLNFHYWIIMIFAIVSLVMLNKNRDLLAKTHRLMNTELGRYKGRLIYKEERLQKLMRKRRQQTIQFLFLPGLVLLIAGGVLVIPYIQKIKKGASYTSNGVNLNLPIAVWYPFATDRGFTHFLALGGQLMTGACLGTIVASLELTLFRVGQQLIFEYNALCYAVETIYVSAQKIYDLKFENRPLQKCKFKNENFQSCIGECIKACVEHHYRITELLSGFENLVKWPGALAYFCGTGVIALSLINIQTARESANYENFILFSTLAVAEVLNMYILSMFGEAITSECEILRNELYFIEWQKLNVRNRKMLLNFLTGVTSPVIVKAGGLVDMCMDTFSSEGQKTDLRRFSSPPKPAGITILFTQRMALIGHVVLIGSVAFLRFLAISEALISKIRSPIDPAGDFTYDSGHRTCCRDIVIINTSYSFFNLLNAQAG